ncbi:MAG: 1,2-phenylacetyl-CoA epoxidase subunit PaaD, partial [Myxococcota bacterium]
DLGMIHEVKIQDNKANITFLPTFSGCPALDYIQDSIKERVKQLPLDEVEVVVTYEVPWNTNRITEKWKTLLKQSGLAPPEPNDGYISLDVLSDTECPYCGSRNTVLQSPFGPTLCRAIHYCKNCSQAFEQFKPVA